MISRTTLQLCLMAFAISTIAFNESGCAKKRQDPVIDATTRRLADGGDPAAQLRIAVSYSRGQGAAQDYKQAAYWANRAADQGDSNAQYFLGTLYFDGHGVPQDLVKAHLWFTLAASDAKVDVLKKGYTELCDKVAAKMTPQQLAQAREMEQNWKPARAK